MRQVFVCPRKPKTAAKTWQRRIAAGVLEVQLTAMPFDDGDNHGKTKPVTRCCAALIDPKETLGHIILMIVRNTDAAICDLDHGSIIVMAHADRDQPTLRRELDCIVQKIGDRLEDKIAVADQRRLVDIGSDRHRLGIGERAIEIDGISHKLVQLDLREGVFLLVRLDFRDPEQRVEHAQDAIDIVAKRGTQGRIIDPVDLCLQPR